MTFTEAYSKMKTGNHIYRYVGEKDPGYKTYLQIAIGRILRGMEKSSGIFWQPAQLGLDDLDATDWKVVESITLP